MNKIAEALRVAHRALSIMSFDARCNDADRQVTAALPLAEVVPDVVEAAKWIARVWPGDSTIDEDVVEFQYEQLNEAPAAYDAANGQ